MKKILLAVLLAPMLFSQDIDSLLDEYQETNNASLQKVDEKLGHLSIYSQADIQKMQYHKLGEILQELPHINYNLNRLGHASLSLAGTKTQLNGFIRFFINDQEISSLYTQSPFLNWGDIPLDFVESVEIYYGDSSFALGNETGIYFVRIYTKEAYKQNGGELILRYLSKGANAQSVMYADTLQNGWSYYAFANREELRDKRDYKDERLFNNEKREYLFFNIENERTDLQIGYAGVRKDSYMGLAFDVVPESGALESKNLFINTTHSFLEDKSLQAKFSVNQQERMYREENAEGLATIPIIDLENAAATIPKYFNEELRYRKLNAYLSKTFSTQNNQLFAALNFTQKKYKVLYRENTNLLGETFTPQRYNDFDKETAYSLLLQDDFFLRKDLSLIANFKLDKYERNGDLENTTETMFRIGSIYTPLDNLGFKAFYTRTYLPPTFYSVEFMNKDESTPDEKIKPQKYSLATLEGVYTLSNTKFSVIYSNVRIDDFLYMTPVGFIHVPYTVKVEGIVFDLKHQFNDAYELELSYFDNHISEIPNNAKSGGFVKMMGGYKAFSYFASLIYRESYSYMDVEADASYDLSLGLQYDYSKDITFNIKGENLLEKSTQTFYTDHSNSSYAEVFAFEDYEKRLSLSLRWKF